MRQARPTPPRPSNGPTLRSAAPIGPAASRTNGRACCTAWPKAFARGAKSWRIGRAVAAGTVWINTYKQFSIATPFGGWRDSGIGREKGRLGILEYMEQKSLYWGMNVAPLPWAA